MAKFLWGDLAFTMPFMFACIFKAALVTGAVLIFLGPEGTVGHDNTFPSPQALKGVVLVSATFALVSYLLLGNQIGIKFAANVPAAEAEAAAKIAERGVYNNIEQSIPFLILLWLNALFVNPRTSAVLGWIYVASRYLYPIAYGVYGQFNNLIEVVQQFTYTINAYFMIAVFYKCVQDSDFHTDVADKSPYLMLLVGLLAGLLCTVLYLVGGKPGATVILRGVKWEKTYDEKKSALVGDESDSS